VSVDRDRKKEREAEPKREEQQLQAAFESPPEPRREVEEG
jgi:hypothetical protein